MNWLKTTGILFIIFGLLGCKNNQGVDAKFTYSIDNGGIVAFTNSTSGLVDGYEWAFGDGNTSNEASPVHKYLKSGTYIVTLSASGESGTGTKEETIEILFDDFNPLEGHITFDDADGCAYSVNQFNYETDDLGNKIENKFGQAIGTFFDDDNFLVTAGLVSVNGYSLELGSNNAYSFSADDSSNITTDTMFYFTGDVNWSIYGGNGFPPILQTTRQGFPAVSEIIANTPGATPEPVDPTKDYFATTVNPIIGADSLSFQISDEQGIVLLKAIVDDTQTSHTFLSADLVNLPKGELKLSITAFSYEDYLFKGKKIYFINESVVSKKILVQ